MGGTIFNGSRDEHRLLTIFKDYYEIRALSCVLENNMDDFEQAIKDVLQFYSNCGDATDLRVDAKFQQRYLMYGLFLMYLLGSNKLAEFRMLIEQIDHSVRVKDPYLDVPIKLERYLSDGSYNKMFLTEKNLPTKYYIPFINILKQAVQNEISLGLETAYRSIPIADAAKQLIMSNAEVLAFGTRNNTTKSVYVSGSDPPASAQPPIQREQPANPPRAESVSIDNCRILPQRLYCRRLRLRHVPCPKQTSSVERDGLDFYGTLFPRIPVPIQKDIESKFGERAKLYGYEDERFGGVGRKRSRSRERRRSRSKEREREQRRSRSRERRGRSRSRERGRRSRDRNRSREALVKTDASSNGELKASAASVGTEQRKRQHKSKCHHHLRHHHCIKHRRKCPSKAKKTINNGDEEKKDEEKSSVGVCVSAVGESGEQQLANE
uniref:26S proteasome non-ATPase regulatory subunit 8 n=1 Tax=Globodera rostochiensis TaxID=31243 RepID=A0A914H2X0_GLORO